MTVPINLHEAVRDSVDPRRASSPGRFVNLEHRGDGEGSWPREPLLEAIEIIVAHLFGCAREGSSIWMRTTGGEGEYRFAAEWEGPALPADAAERLRALASTLDATFSDRGSRVELTLPRSDG